MKNSILTFLICLISIVGSTQTLSIYPKVLRGAGTNTGGQDFISTVTNNTTNTVDTTFRWKILQYNPPSAWLMSFCDPINCVAKIAVDSSGIFYIAKGKSGQMHITYTFNNVAGADTLRFAIQSLLTPSSVDTLTMYASSWRTGVKEVANSNEVSIYPNPAKDILNVKLNSPLNSTIEIYNVIGVKIKTFSTDGSLSKLNIADLKNGMYILRVIDGNSTYSKTFNKTE